MSRLSVILPVQNEAETLPAVLREVKRLHPAEIVAVVNGSTDQTREIAIRHGCRVITYPMPLGNDVGRALGAFHSRGDILLFVDGDFPVPAEQLRPFIQAIQNGHDVALNNLAWTATMSALPHYTTVAKQAVNLMLRQPPLGVNSLLAVPHAISRRALETVGWRHLADPVLAQALAVHHGLSIIAPAVVDVISPNRIRPVHCCSTTGASPYPDSTNRILGDHLSAINTWTHLYGPRGGFPEGRRQRGLLARYVAPPRIRRAKRSAVVPVGEERATITEVIRSVRLAGVDEVIVVANGSDRQTIQQALRSGAKVIPFAEPLGHNVGRAIGAAHATGEVCLFVDGDFVIHPADLVPFLRAVEQGVDVALNDLEPVLYRFQPMDTISTVKYFLNLAIQKPELLNNSLTAVPHAMHRRVLDRIGYKSLMIPPVAQVKAVRAGFLVKAVHAVDVINPNRIRPDHYPVNGMIPAFARILGDHVEGLHYLLSVTDSRGGFIDGNRARHLLSKQE